MHPHTSLLAALTLVLASSGCAAQVGDDGATQAKSDPLLTDFYSLYLYGGFTLSFDLAGRGLNGQSWNGKTLDGHAVTRVSLDGVLLDARGHAADLQLVGSGFAKAGVGGNHGGMNVDGARFSATLDDGDAIALRIADSIDGKGKDHDVTRYLVTYETGAGTRSLCGVAADGTPLRAIPLAGMWDLRAGVAGGGAHHDDARGFTFACEGKVLADCVTMGYKPWVVGQLCDGKRGSSTCKDVAIADYHQACTRMLRADYCGDGAPHTVDGTVIAAWDALGIRVQDPAFALEAEWTPSGARCARRTRVAGPTPKCWAGLQKPDCGADAHFLDGTLLMSGVAP